MSLPLWATHVTAALNLLTLVACTFATIAAVGFRGTEWGHALAPLPVVFAVMTASTAARFHPATPNEGGLLTLGLWRVAVAAIALSGWRFAALMTEQRWMMR